MPSFRELVEAIDSADPEGEYLQVLSVRSKMMDPWGNMIRVVRGGSGCHLLSYGPNRMLDGGKGDDIVVEIRFEVQRAR